MNICTNDMHSNKNTHGEGDNTETAQKRVIFCVGDAPKQVLALLSMVSQGLPKKRAGVNDVSPSLDPQNMSLINTLWFAIG